jgi:MFS family permease
MPLHLSRERLLVPVLGIFQIFAWGSSFYLLAVLAKPIAADTGWSLTWIVGALSAGLLVAGAVSPRVGLLIGSSGGRTVLATGCVLLAMGLATIGAAPNIAVFVFGWLIIGVGMGAGLYDPAFATLGHSLGDRARPAITTLTLWGGFASTVCWPLSALFVDHLGWRAACVLYAGIHLCLNLPLLLAVIPAQGRKQAIARSPANNTDPLTPHERRCFLAMSALVVIIGLIMSIISVHLLVLLQAQGMTLAAAVSLGALIGPAQVAARIGEMAGRGRHHPLWTVTASVVLVAIGLTLLTAGFPVAALSLILYGAGNGLSSIARGTLPLAFFGPGRYGALIGRLARPHLMAQAIAPSLGALVISAAGGHSLMLILTGLAFVNLALAALLWRLSST